MPRFLSSILFFSKPDEAGRRRIRLSFVLPLDVLWCRSDLSAEAKTLGSLLYRVFETGVDSKSGSTKDFEEKLREIRRGYARLTLCLVDFVGHEVP